MLPRMHQLLIPMTQKNVGMTQKSQLYSSGFFFLSAPSFRLVRNSKIIHRCWLSHLESELQKDPGQTGYGVLCFGRDCVAGFP